MRSWRTLYMKQCHVKRSWPTLKRSFWVYSQKSHPIYRFRCGISSTSPEMKLSWKTTAQGATFVGYSRVQSCGDESYSLKPHWFSWMLITPSTWSSVLAKNEQRHWKNGSRLQCVRYNTKTSSKLLVPYEIWDVGLPWQRTACDFFVQNNVIISWLSTTTRIFSRCIVW